VGRRPGPSPLSARTLEHRPIAAIAQLPADRISLLLALGAAAWVASLGLVLAMV
jgi:hypothetical protein